MPGPRAADNVAMSTFENRPNSALLVVDVQNLVVDGAHRRAEVVATIASLTDRARRRASWPTAR